MHLTADPGVSSLIPARSISFVVIDHQIISSHFSPSADSKRVVVSFKGKYVQKVLVNHLVKPRIKYMW